ncbi:MAG TPA: NADH-quinone oxidoreductase subunit M, partial [Acidimicrobiales bacterium]|nr:NADH-quinone oxidoreductase subunit M [Acidimicrobiales bacterium]
MDGFEDWALTVGTFLPLAGAIVMMLVPRESEETHKWIALLTTIATFGVGIWVLAEFDYTSSGLQFAVNEKWIDVI